MTKQEEVEQLRAEQDAVTLVHYYVDPQVQEVADCTGDSFYLSKAAAGLDRRTTMLCGVSLMGESGKLLSPDKVVLIPDAQADCPMTHVVTREEVEQCRREYSDLAVVCYINSTAEIRSWSNVCVTFANAVQIVRNLSNRDILFISDKSLGRYVASQVPEKHAMPVDGCYPVHDQIPPEEVSVLKRIYLNAQVLAHPKYNAQVLELADYTGSTIEILKFAADSTSRESIICTENGVRHKLERQNPGKHFYLPDIEPIRRNMRRTTLGKTTYVLRTGQNQVSVPKAHVPSADRILEQILNSA